MINRDEFRKRLTEMLRSYAGEVMTPGSDSADPGLMADRIMIMVDDQIAGVREVSNFYNGSMELYARGCK